MMEMHLFSIKDVLKRGWSLTKEHLWFLLGYQGIQLLISLSLLQLGKKYIGFKTLEILFYLFASLGWFHSLLLITRGIKPSLDQMFMHWRQFIWYMFGFLLYMGMVLVGLCLFIVPGIYLANKYALACFYLIDQDMWPVQAFKAAGEASKGVRWRLFIFSMAVIGINLLGLLCLLVGFYLTIPMTTLAFTLIYLRLSERKQPLQPGEPLLVQG